MRKQRAQWAVAYKLELTDEWRTAPGRYSTEGAAEAAAKRVSNRNIAATEVRHLTK